MKVYVLVMSNINENGTFDDFDVFGIYSTYNKASKAMDWRRRDDGLYDGCSEHYVYKYCYIVERIIDFNLPKNEPEKADEDFMKMFEGLEDDIII